MASEKKEAVYFGCIPKDQVLPAIETFKKALGESEKKGEEKLIGFTIKGTKEDPKGFAVETYSYKEDKFNEYFDMEQPHLKEALTCITFQLHVNDESQVPVMKALFDQYLPLLQNTEY